MLRKFTTLYGSKRSQRITKYNPINVHGRAINNKQVSNTYLRRYTHGGQIRLNHETLSVLNMISSYRKNGHLYSQTNPLIYEKSEGKIDGSWDAYETLVFDVGDLDVHTPNKSQSISLRDLENHLRATYCGPISAQLAHIPENEAQWLTRRMEQHVEDLKNISSEDKRHIFSLINKAETFDHYLHKKFRTVKRYGLEGNESILVSLDTLFRSASSHGIDDVVISMMHRGRLNALVCLLQYPMELMVRKLKGKSLVPETLVGYGDVLSHIDQTTDLDINGKNLHVSLIPNPSHLESSGPVAMGKCYSKQKNRPRGHSKALCVMMHGDASVIGQGIVPETLLLSNLEQFSVGGSINIVVNNQVGFTATAKEGRSSLYCSDLAKTTDSPVIHVNADYPEHVYIATKIAMEYRDTFKKDVWIDIVGYRKHGHNELDEPDFTQPTMYKNIRNRKSSVEKYGDELTKLKVLSEGESVKMKKEFEDFLESGFQKEMSISTLFEYPHLQGKWSSKVQPSELTQAISDPITGEDESTLLEIGEASIKYEDITIHPRLIKGFIDARREKMSSKKGLDWATGEALAIGSILEQGYNVRLCGQDVGRGTFSHRHMKLVDQNDQDKYYIPLNHFSKHQGDLQLVNSPLSELAVMGFEYGYSIDDPNTLNIWEAQFGDFANGAQVIIDQYVSSGEDKWLRQSGLVVSLPHGYDGGGPEHSSSKMERFLQLCNTDPLNVNALSNRFPNMHVIVPTTPAQIYHALKRQMKRNYMKPLIVVGPKTLIRDPSAVSDLDEFVGNTKFSPVLPDPDHQDALAGSVRRVILCSGKIFYDLRKERRQRKRGDTALIRVEELSPFPAEHIKAELQKYPRATKFYWVQEEPLNMGAWSYVTPFLKNFVGIEPIFVGLAPLASSAVGSTHFHNLMTSKLMEDAFTK